MQEFFFTVLAIWVIWRLFGAFSGSSNRSSQSYQQTTHHHYYSGKNSASEKKDSEVRIETKKPSGSRIPADEGEYVDYEEVKE